MNFFRKFFSYTEYFEEMNPKARIRKVLEVYVSPEFEKWGYVLDKKKLLFVKKNEDTFIEIEFRQNKYALTGQIVSFDINIFVYSNAYNAWRSEQHNGSEEKGHFYFVRADCIRNWPGKYAESGGWYDLASHDNELLVERLLENFKTIAFPFLDRFSNLESSADCLMEINYFPWTPMLFDFCIITNNKIKAQTVIQWFNNRALPKYEVNPETVLEMKQRELLIDSW